MERGQRDSWRSQCLAAHHGCHVLDKEQKDSIIINNKLVIEQMEIIQMLERGSHLRFLNILNATGQIPYVGCTAIC